MIATNTPVFTNASATPSTGLPLYHQRREQDENPDRRQIFQHQPADSDRSMRRVQQPVVG
ncbi:MAG: hypothetical protein U0521_11340 [Anaerolineae bacterium]